MRPLTARCAPATAVSPAASWATAFSDYLHLGAVYGLLPGDLNDDLAGMPGEIGDPHFVGLHRIEMGLWTDQPVTSLAPLGVKLSSAVDRLRAELPTAAVDPQSTHVRLARGLVAVTVDPLDFTLRIHEILEDAQRDFMSGLDVPWSGAGVLATAAGVVATKELLSTVEADHGRPRQRVRHLRVLAQPARPGVRQPAPARRQLPDACTS